jgi:hypothetical protein
MTAVFRPGGDPQICYVAGLALFCDLFPTSQPGLKPSVKEGDGVKRVHPLARARLLSPQTNCPEKLIFRAEELGLGRVSSVLHRSSYTSSQAHKDPDHITFKSTQIDGMGFV